MLNTWSELPAELILKPHEIHVWKVRLDRPEEQIRRLAETLSLTETERSRSSHFPEDYARYVVSHTVLRLILARYLGFEPWDVKFDVGPYGRSGDQLSGQLMSH